MTAPTRHGLLLLNKNSGVTSFDSLKAVKRTFGTQKAGHTGTLDKFASGLLLVLVGRGVKIAPLFADCAKEYIAAVRFGMETDTLDPEGKVIAEGKVPSREDVEAVLPAFRGSILQAPPAYSAIHINGKRAHELVRGGNEPLMKKRPVTIHELEIISWTPPDAVIRVRCSAGTYVRSLARDMALAANSRGYLVALKRTRVGVFCLEDSVEDTGDDETLAKALRPLDRELFAELSLPCFTIDDTAAQGFINGKSLKGLFPEPGGAAAAVFGNAASERAGRLLGILENRNGSWSYGHVFADS